jgi:hypothetical protein
MSFYLHFGVLLVFGTVEQVGSCSSELSSDGENMDCDNLQREKNSDLIF